MHRTTWLRLFLSCSLLATACLGARASGCNLVWQPVTPKPANEGFEHVAFGAGIYVAAGLGGRIFTSVDGTSWVRRMSGTRDDIMGLAFGNGRFVAIAKWTRLTSTDGIHWNVQYPADLVSWTLTCTGLQFCGGRFLGLFQDTQGSLIWISTDGLNWEAYPLRLFQASDVSTLVAYPKGYMVLAGDALYKSKNGWKWKQYASAPKSAFALIYGAGRFVVLAYPYTVIYTSLDGKNWDKESLDTNNCYPKSGIFLNGHFFLNDGALGLMSTDGLDWTPITLSDTYLPPVPSKPFNMAFGSAGYVSGFAFGQVCVSADGTHWNDIETHTDIPLPTVFYYASSFHLFLGSSSNGKLWSSEDGKNWTDNGYGCGDPCGPPPGLSGFADGHGLAVAVGSKWDDTLGKGVAYVAVSSNGTSWEGINSPQAQPLTSVAYGQGTFVAVGWRGAILRSSDGYKWTPVNAGVSGDFNKVIFAGGLFIAAGGRQILVSSPDGINWQGQKSGSDDWNDVASICYGAGRYLVLQPPYHQLWTSTDGLSWQEEQVDLNNPPYYLHRIFGTFFMVCQNGTLESSDGLHWKDSLPGMGITSWQVAASDDLAIASGSTSPHLSILEAHPCYPSIFSIWPDSVPTGEGTTVVLAGSHLADVTQVYFGGEPAASFFVDSDDQVTAVTPAMPAGGADVTVTTQSGFSPESLDTILVVGDDRPAIAGVKEKNAPFKLVVQGSGFHPGCILFVNGLQVPRTKVKKATKLLAYSSGLGYTLEDMLPPGQPVTLRVLDIDTNTPSEPYTYVP